MCVSVRVFVSHVCMYVIYVHVCLCFCVQYFVWIHTHTCHTHTYVKMRESICAYTLINKHVQMFIHAYLSVKCVCLYDIYFNYCYCHFMLLQLMVWLQWRQAVALLFRGDQVAAQRALTCHIPEGEHASYPRPDL